MFKGILHLWHSLAMLQKRHSSHQKYHLRKMASNKKQHLTKMTSQNLYYWFSEVLPTPC